MRLIRFLMASIVWCLLTTAARPAFAQTAVPAPAAGPTAGSLSGTVSDEQGGVLPGAAIVATHLPSGRSTEAVASADGRYTLDGLRAGGPYLVRAVMTGFRAQDVRDVFVSLESRRTVDFRLPLDAMSEEVTVTGSTLARDQKRAARNIMDTVSADSVGRFPDANAAEALRRIPGVSMEIDQGEGRFVVVRGVDANLNNVTLNGQALGSPAQGGTRGVSMDSVPADLISRLEVVKAVTPDMDANAIGASINIATIKAFDRPEGFMSGSVRTGYNDMGGPAPFSGSATWGRVLDAKKRWGLVLGGSYSRRRYDTQLFDPADSWALRNDFFVPQNRTFFLYDIDRRRQGVNGALDFRPSAGQDLYVRINHNQFQDTEGRQQTAFEDARGTLSNQTATSGRFSEGRATREYRDYLQRHLINAAMVGGNHTALASRYTVDWKAGASRGQRRTPRRNDWEFRSAATAFPNTYDITDPLFPVITPSDNYYSASAYPFRRVRFRHDLEREDVFSGELNVRRDTTIGARTAYWKAGIRGVRRDKRQDRENQNYNVTPGAANAFTLADFDLGGPEPDNFFDGRYRFGPTLNLPALTQFFAAHPERFTFDAVGSLQNSTAEDFDARETVGAGYAMAAVEGTRWALLGGVRVENTDARYGANEQVFSGGAFTGRINRVNGGKHYTNVLPGVHLNVFPTEKLTMRVAWTNTIGRPAYADLAPTRALDDILNEDGSYTGSVSMGNPELKPYESMNIDGSIEYYLKGGIISVAPFHKRIENPIYDRSFIQRDTIFNERLYDTLGFSQPENARRGRITGVEFSYQHTFAFLPAPLDGFGVNLNYTRTSSSVTVFGREADDLPFFKQADHIGNIALLYEKHGLSAQLSISFNSPYLDSLGADRNGDTYTDRYRPIGAKVSVPLRRKLRGTVEVRNLNDAPRLRYAGQSNHRVQHEIYSWTLFAGIDWRM